MTIAMFRFTSIDSGSEGGIASAAASAISGDGGVVKANLNTSLISANNACIYDALL